MSKLFEREVHRIIENSCGSFCIAVIPVFLVAVFALLLFQSFLWQFSNDF